MKLYVYKMKDGIEKSWDDIDFQKDIEVVAEIEGETNEECERKAVDAGYDDTEKYGWTYSDGIPHAMNKETLKKEIEQVVKDGYDWLVIVDKETNDKHVYGSSASYSNIKAGGGKFAIIDTNEVKTDYILFNEQYNTLDEFVDIILNYWNN